jgi:hypothetical protein
VARFSLNLAVLAVALCAAPPAWAQALDASVPDASVGQSGAEQTSEENDPNASPCLSSNACTGNFTCSGGRCVPRPFREATTGCQVAPAGALVALGLLLASRRSRG